MPRKNDVLPLAIESVGLNGEGIAHLEGQVVFVSGGLPGEVCDTLILKVGRSAIWGKAMAVKTPSPDRVAPDCPQYPKCGGCQFRHMSYDAELEAKRRRVEDAIRRVGGLDLAASVILGAKNTQRYRNKVQLPVAAGKDGPRIGFFRARSHDVVNVDDCLLQPETASALARAVRRWMADYAVPAYDERAHAGLVRHLFVRFSRTQALCCLVVNGEKLPHERELVEALRAAAPELTGVVLSVNQERTNVVLGRALRTLWGRDFLEDTLCGLTFRISVPSFYQVNRDQCEVLYGKAVELAGLTGTETVVDLYCGIGTISLAMARHAGRVIGAEIVPSAVEDAKNNAARNGIANAEFFCGDAADTAARLAAEGLRPDVICVDPPRKGLAPEVVASIAQMAPERVVYVSCDPATLARDLARFGELGYAARTAVAVDMFPRTAHVETVCLLSKEHDMILQTERLVLRRWRETDAESLYEYAKDPAVGPIAGWPAHRSLEESRTVIREVFQGAECYAICERGRDRAIGAVELKLRGSTDMTDREDECELGYWLGKPFWGRGYMPEAAEALLRRGFQDLGMTTIWCGCYDGNAKSKRVQEKLGFVHHHTCDQVPVPLLNEVRVGHTSRLTKAMWETMQQG